MDQEEVKYFYIMWCLDCQKAGLDSLECCDKPKREMGWAAQTESTDTQG
jgi:hypothetical protein